MQSKITNLVTKKTQFLRPFGTAAFPLFPKESLLLLSFGTRDCLYDLERSCLGQHPHVPDNVNVFVPRKCFFFW